MQHRLSFIDRVGSDSLKWSVVEPDVIPLWLGDLDCAPPSEVLTALRKRLDHPVLGYARPSREVTQGVLGYLSHRFAADVSDEAIVWLPNIDFGLSLFCHCLPAGSRVAVPMPAYPVLRRAPVAAGLHLRLFSLPNAQPTTSVMKWSELIRSLSEREIDAVMLSNPDNPTGKVLQRVDLTLLSESCAQTGTPLCIDEAFADIVFDPHRHVSSTSLENPQVVTLMSPGKAFGTTGIPSAFAILRDSALRRRFREASGGTVMNPGVFGYEVCRAAYSVGPNWRRDLISHLTKNRAAVRAFATRSGLEMSCNEGTFFGWLNCISLGAHSPKDFFFQQARVAVSSGDDYGSQQHIRLNYGCSTELLSRAIARMENAIHESS